MTKEELDTAIKAIHQLNQQLASLYQERKSINSSIAQREEERARNVRFVSSGIETLVREGLPDDN